jgi:hypothetical protein
MKKLPKAPLREHSEDRPSVSAAECVKKLRDAQRSGRRRSGIPGRLTGAGHQTHHATANEIDLATLRILAIEALCCGAILGTCLIWRRRWKLLAAR